MPRPIHSTDGAHHVNLDGWEPHLENLAPIRHGGWRQFGNGKSEGLESSQETRSVLDRGADEDIQVAGETRSKGEALALLSSMD